jgi:small conductance mechanosensitive channel
MIQKILIKLFLLGIFLPLGAQAPAESSNTQPQAPSKIEIRPSARDYEIQDRLEAILEATEWFYNPQAEVKEGVVFLSGIAKKEEYKKWAGDLARNTQDVSAVVNRLEVAKPSIWDFHPTWRGLKEQWRDLVQILPTIAFGIIILLLTWLLAKIVISFTRKIIKKRVPSPLLQEVIARAVGFCAFLLGFYIIFRMLGLTMIAFTIIGGTGILGVVLGIAFRDITENLLASIFLSIHHPFKSGDLVQIEKIQGYVQKLTIRSTILLGLDGNHIQIPNATVYKSNILNYSINPNRQENFLITIAYNEAITNVQDIILKVLSNHPAVLDNPEPLVLVESLEKATIFIRTFFWFNGQEHSWLKVRSSVMRLVKRELQEKEIQIAAETRELTFPESLPIRILEKDHEIKEAKPDIEPAPVATTSENDLSSEYQDLQKQANLGRKPETKEENLLNN